MSDPSLNEIQRARDKLADFVETTPVMRFESVRVLSAMGPGTRLHLKLELLQRAGSFKVRAAFLHLLALNRAQLARGVTTVSAGNHAVAVAYAAQRIGCSAKLVLFESANPLRRELCRRYGAELLFATPHEGFALGERIAQDEGRTFIHPFESENCVLGAATVGLELGAQCEPLDAIVVPIGGGGFAAGMSVALKAMWPDCRIYGIEPEGAPSMFNSFALGAPQELNRVDTIADSLAPPRALPLTFDLCQRHLNSVHLVSDDEIRNAMRIMFTDFKLGVEPAASASLAGVLGPLKKELQGASIGLIACGSNIDPQSYARLIL